jgi:hypothetical protein
MDFVLNRIVGHFLDDKPEQEPVGVAVIVRHPGRKQRRLFAANLDPLWRRLARPPCCSLLLDARNGVYVHDSAAHCGRQCRAFWIHRK